MKQTIRKANEQKKVVPARLVDLSVLYVSFNAYNTALETAEREGGQLLSKGARLVKRFSSQMQRAFEQHVSSVMERPDSAPLRMEYRQALRSGSPVKVAQRQAAFLQRLFPWLKKRPAVFNGLFHGRAAKGARSLALICNEEAPEAILNKAAAMTPVSGITVPRKWVEKAAADVGAPISSVESVMADASSAREKGAKLSETETQLAIVEPNSPREAELQQKRLELLNHIEKVADSSKDRGTVLSAASDAADTPTKSAVASQFGLTDEQADVMSANGNVVVAAGAGSGKTLSLVATIKHMVEEQGYAPGQVLTCSFTRAASAELDARLEKAGVSGVSAGTTHSVARGIIERHRPEKVLAMRNTTGADKCFKIAMLQVEMDAEGYRRQLEENKATMARIENIPGWRRLDILRSFHDQLSRGRTLSPKQLAVLPKFEHSRGGYRRRWAADLEQQWFGKKANENDTQRKSKYWRTPIGEWFNVGEKLVNAKGEKLSLRRAQLQVENFKNAGISVETARRDGGGTPIVALYGAYEWLKQNDPAYGPAMDFTDQLVEALKIVEEDPRALAQEQAQFKCILVDEAQDLNDIQFKMFEKLGEDADTLMYVGDDKQCVAIDTPVDLFDEGDSKRAGILKPGDEILAYRNGVNVVQTVEQVRPSPWTWGYRIETESGRFLTMSPNHRLWATEPHFKEHEVAVYIMYQHDTGFRIGITNKGKTGANDYFASYGGHCFVDKAERLWILEICQNREEALLREAACSLQYGVPTTIFDGGYRGVNQDKLNALLQGFEQNGMKMLDAKHLSFDLPHWMSQTYTKHGKKRHTLNVVAHRSINSQVTMEWSGDKFDAALKDMPGVSTAPKNRRCLRRWFDNYRDAVSFTKNIASKTEAQISWHLSTPKGLLQEIPASGLFVGMHVPVREGNSITLDPIVSIEKVETEFVDLSINDASNFFGGGILSHNSIYAFRGAKPSNYVNLTKKDNFQTKLMTMNFRSGSEIVDAGNRLIAHNGERQVPMVCKAHEAKGKGAIRAKTPETHEEGAVLVAQEIKDAIDAGESASDFGILVRNNAETDAFTLSLISRGIPYRTLRKDQGYFGKPVVRALTAWIRLVIGGSDTELNDAVVEAHRTPGFGMNKQFEAQLGRMARGTNYLDYILSGGEVYTGRAAWMNKRVAQYADAIRQVMAEGRMESDPLIRAIFKLRGIRGTFVDSLLAMVNENDIIEDDAEGGEEALRMAALAPVRPLMQMAENFPEPSNLLHFIGKMKKANEKAQKKNPETKEDYKEPAVLIGTVHGWKGLQAKHVYVNMAGGIFPNFRSDQKAEEQEATGDPVTAYDEERRLAYVAITRGEQSSTVLCPTSNYLGKPSEMSQFVVEACIPIEGEVEEEQEEDLVREKQAAQEEPLNLVDDAIYQLRNLKDDED